MKAVRLLDEEPEAIEIEFEATSGEIPNMGDPYAGLTGSDDARGELFVTSVTGKSGKNLLRRETCGQERNEKGGPLAASTQHIFVDNNFVQVPILQGVKKVRLEAGTALPDLGSVQGFVRLRLPTETETRILSAPFEGQVVETGNTRIKFSDGGPNGIAYEVSGEARALLAVRGLNAQKAYLAGAGSFSSGRIFGTGKSVGQDYQGQPAFAEVVLVTRETEADYPFTLSRSLPQFSVWDYPAAFEVETSSAKAFDAEYGKVNSTGACSEASSDAALLPFSLCITSMRPSWGDSLHGQFVIAAPDTPALAGNLSALEVVLRTLETDDRQSPLPVGHRQFVVLSRGYGGDEPFIRANDYVLIEDFPGMEESKILSVDGTLVVRLPQELDRMTLDVTNLGNAANSGAGHEARLLGIENGSLRFALSGPRESFVQFQPRNSDGKAMATNNERIEAGNEPEQWIGSLRVSGAPATLEIVYAARQEKLEFPFSLRVE